MPMKCLWAAAERVSLAELPEGRGNETYAWKKIGIGLRINPHPHNFNAGLAYVKANSIKDAGPRHAIARALIAALKDLQRDLNQTQSRARQTILAGGDPARKDAANSLFAGAWNDVDKDVAQLDQLATKWTLQLNRDRLLETKQELPSLREFQEAAMKHASSGEREAISKAGNEFADTATPVTDAIEKPLDEMADSVQMLIEQDTAEVNAKNRSMGLTMAATTIGGLGIGIFVSMFLIRGITAATQAVLAQSEAIGRDESAELFVI